MEYISFLLLFSIFPIEIYGSTHWMVTEGGLIQPRVCKADIDIVTTGLRRLDNRLT